MPLTVDELYEAFMDEETPFAEDVFAFFEKDKLGGLGQTAWAKEYGTYLPTWDPSQVNLAGRKRDLSYRDAMNLLETTQAATDSVYSTELDTLSTSLGREMSKGREIAGGIGLRSGGLESALQDTIATTGSKAKDFGDRMRITGKETKDKYNSAMVDSALDFEKTERDEKEEFYDRTMAAIMKLMETGAFDPSAPDDIVTPLEEDFNEFSEGYQECVAYCGENTDCMYDCAAAAGEGTVFFDEFFHTDYENIYEDLGDLSGLDEEEVTTLIDTGTELAHEEGFFHDACCAAAKTQSLGHCLGRWGKAYTNCRNSYHNTACGGC